MYHWDGTSGPWHSSSNWYEGEPPVTDSSACINVPDSQTITYSMGSLQIASLACSENLAIQGTTSPCLLATTEPSFVRGDLTLENNNTVLQVDDRLDIDGLFEWTGSNVTSSAKLTGSGVTYANGGTVISQIVHLEDHHLILDGNSTSVCSGRVDFNGASVFEIRPGSTYEHQGSGGIFSGWFDDSFVNGGTLIKSVNTDASNIYMHTENSGLIHVKTGTLKFYLGGSSTGDFVADPGALLNFTGGHEFLPGSSIVAENILFSSGISQPNTVRGAYDVSNATTVQDGMSVTFTDQANIISYGSSFYITGSSVTFNAIVGGTIHFDSLQAGNASFNSGDPVQVTNLTLGSGTISGPSNITIDGLLIWNSAGGFTGPKTVNANGPVQVNSGSGQKTISNCTFNNADTATLLTQLGLSSSTFNNLPGGVMDVRHDSGVFGLSSSSSFHNAGTLVKSAGTGTTTMLVHTENSGTVEVQSGVLSYYGAYGLTHVQTAGQTVLNGGDLAFTQGAFCNLQGGLLTGAGTVFGNVVSTGGTTAPGLSIGQLNVNGNYTQGAGAALQIEISGADPGQADKLVCTGTASLAGTLEIVLTGGFQPQPGNHYKIVSAGSVVGTFDTLVGADLPGDDDFTVIYTPNAVYLGICPMASPDFDGDCDVDNDDYTAFEACASGPDVAHAPGCEGKDLDLDTDVDQFDFGIFQRCLSGADVPADPACDD
jgi:hypothetical protein